MSHYMLSLSKRALKRQKGGRWVARAVVASEDDCDNYGQIYARQITCSPLLVELNRASARF